MYTYTSLMYRTIKYFYQVVIYYYNCYIIVRIQQSAEEKSSRFVVKLCVVKLNRSADAKRSRDALCLSVVSFNSTKRRVESFIVKLLALQHRRRSREGGSAGPDTHNNLVVRVLYGLDPHNNLATLQNL